MPPIYYLTWLTPLEPFEECYFQHICEYDEDAQVYIAALKEHYFANDYSIENIVLMLCQRLEKYASVSAQNNIETPLSTDGELPNDCFSMDFAQLLKQSGPWAV